MIRGFEVFEPKNGNMMSISSNAWPGALFLLPLGAAVIYFLGFSIYLYFFHPLAKHPGPFLAKFTTGYAAYHAWKGDLHIDMWRCHAKYGNFVRYAPNRLNVNTSSGMRSLYSQGKNFRKSKGYVAMVHRAYNTLTLTDKEEHARRRRVLSQGFSDASMRRHEVSMLAQIHKFCVALAQGDEGGNLSGDPSASPEKWLPARNMSTWCNYLAFDIMADIIFGAKKYDLIGKSNYRYVVNAIETSNVRVGVMLQASWLKFARMDKWLFPKSIYARNMFIKFVDKLLRDTMKLDQSNRKDISALLSVAKDPQTGSGFGTAEVIAESTTLVVAGTDTSSTAMAAVFFYLAHNPHAYARAMREVRDNFGTVEDIRMGAKLNSCLYLRACIDEAMRMSPSVGSTLYREVPLGGTVVDEVFVPAGIDVGTSIYSIHHNPAYYPEPFLYSPERWLVSEGVSTSASVERAHSAFSPFSIGPRSCIGKGMALTELMLTMAMVCWHFDFKLAEGDTSGGKEFGGEGFGRHRPNEFQLYDHVTAGKNGPMIHFRVRA